MFKGLTGLKKVVRGGISAVSEGTTQLAEQVVGDPSTSSSHLKESLKQTVKGGVASVVGAKESALEEAEEHTGISKEKVGKVAHDIKHYGAFGEDYLGFSDPTKDLRKAVKQREKAAKKARKAKKKKTGKKEDLFDPENLAKYKKELEEKRRRQELEADRGEDESGDSDAAAAGGNRHEEAAEGEPNLNLNLAAPVPDSGSDTSAAPTPLKEAATPSGGAPAKESENWKLFESLTSGVDHLIKKTQEDLGEIKKESYFQQKQTKVVDKTKEAKEKKQKKKKKKAWVDLDAGGFEDFDGDVDQLREKKKHSSSESEADSSETEEEGGDKDEEHRDEDGQQAAEQEQQQQLQQEEQEEEEKSAKPIVFKEPSVEEVYDPDEDDDLFNTNFVDAITSGDVKLAVVEEDTVIPDEEEDDPFNTAIAEVVVKKQEEAKRKEQNKLKFTGLSSVADVLSGKADKVDKSLVEQTVKRKRRRANRINLIGEDGTEVTNLEEISKTVVDSAKQSDQVNFIMETSSFQAILPFSFPTTT